MKITFEMREYLAERYDVDPLADVETEGESVFVTGFMPHTSEHGRFLVGSLEDIQAEMEREAVCHGSLV